MLLILYIDGIPHASIWLNDTIDGVNGTFIPLNNPAINSSVSERLYILTVFRPMHVESLQDRYFSKGLHMRLYAFDVTGNMADRIQTIWYHDFILPAASIPYVESKESMCKVSYPHDPAAADSAHNTETDKEQKPVNATELPADLVVQGHVVLAAFNYVDSQSGGNHCQLLALTNLGKNYSINFSKDISQQCYGMAYNSHKVTVNEDSPPGKQLLVWLHVFDSAANGSTLLLTDMMSGDVATKVSLSTLIGKRGVKITSRMLIAYLYLGNNTTDHHAHFSEQSSKTPIPFIFGFTDSSGEGSVIAVDLSESDMKVIWTLPLTKDQYVSGQICTVDRLQDSLMVFTDQSGVYFYQISGI